MGLDGVGTILYDVSDPERPVRGGGIATAFPRAVGDGLLITGGGSRPDLWDVSDVHRPRRLAEIATTGNALASALGRGHAFLVVDRQAGDVTVRSYDLADPTTPVEVSSVPVGDLVTRLSPARHPALRPGFPQDPCHRRHRSGRAHPRRQLRHLGRDRPRPRVPRRHYHQLGPAHQPCATMVSWSHQPPFPTRNGPSCALPTPTRSTPAPRSASRSPGRCA